MTDDGGWLIAVTAGRWQRHGIRQAQLAGIKVLAIDGDNSAEGFLDADISMHLDINDHLKVIQELRALDLRFLGAVSFVSEAGMLLAARIREEFGLPGPKTDLTRRLINKTLQRAAWTQNSVPGPRWQQFRSQEEAMLAVPDFQMPFIVKPDHSSGSRGVSKIETERDNIEYCVSQAFQYSKSGIILFESYMDGTEFTVETFSEGGRTHVLAITEKKKVAGTRGTVAVELATPNRPTQVLEKISRAVVDAYKSLGYTDGPGHAEAILMGDNEVGLIEVAGRGGGFMVFEGLVPAVSGVNIARLTALQAIGRSVSRITKVENAAVLRFFPSKPGTVVGIRGLEIANSIEGVQAEAFCKVGDIYSRATTDGDRLGYILATAATPQMAQELANRAEDLIKFDLED